MNRILFLVIAFGCTALLIGVSVLISDGLLQYLFALPKSTVLYITLAALMTTAMLLALGSYMRKTNS